jgi:hypothetical protein
MLLIPLFVHLLIQSTANPIPRYSTIDYIEMQLPFFDINSFVLCVNFHSFSIANFRAKSVKDRRVGIQNVQANKKQLAIQRKPQSP